MQYTKATAVDADIVLRLYDMRREAVMREARKWFFQFSPKSADDVMAVSLAAGTDANAYFRQVTSYWEMAASLALRGAVNQDLFMDWSGEMLYIFGKFHPVLAEVREKMLNPLFLKKMEDLIEQTPGAMDRMEAIAKRQATMSEKRAAASK